MELYAKLKNILSGQRIIFYDILPSTEIHIETENNYK